MSTSAVPLRAERSPGELQPGRLILSLYGLYARTDHHWVAVSALVRLMADLGADEPAVRSSVSRLKRRGTLQSLRLDGAAGYALSPAAIELLREGDVRIFDRRRAALKDGWLLVVFSVPETERDKRHELRTALTRLGFGTVAPGVWIAPGTVAEETRHVLTRRGLDTYVDIFRGDRVAYGDPAEHVGRWWDLADLSTQYAGFIDRYTPLAEQLSDGRLPDDEAFTEYVPMLTTWRRLPYLDPGLPLALLPDPWNGVTAGELFSALNARLAKPARRHAEKAMTQRS